MPARGEGPIPARLMIVGEAWGAEEEATGKPFQGYSGQELNRMLHEAGLMRSEAYVTNLVNARPLNNYLGHWIAPTKKAVTGKHVLLRDKHVLPIVVQGYQSLMQEIEACQPNVIVPVGNAALWALTGRWGITKWRGSMLKMDGQLLSFPAPKVIPTYHPAAVLRQWDWRAIAISDLRRVAKEIHSRDYAYIPQRKFQLRPTFEQACVTLQALLSRMDSSEQLWLELDLETKLGHIDCCGISWSESECIILPFMCDARRDGYFTAEQEAHIVYLVMKVLTHTNAQVRLQNGLYDAQYTWRHWHFVPRIAQDTMIAQHSIWADLPKALAFQASMYSKHYVYWKDEGKRRLKGATEEQHWNYNGLDCVYTREVGEAEIALVQSMKPTWPKVEEVYAFQQQMLWPVLEAMKRGVKVIKANRDRLNMEVQEQISHREATLQRILGHPINPRSSLQMQKLFYEDFQMKPILKKKIVEGRTVMVPTCDDDALNKLAAREPLLKPITNCISDIRTLGIFMSNFILAPLDIDGRMRTAYNIGGSESGKSAPRTYRLSSNENAFGSGTNLMNVPSEKSKSVGKSIQRGHLAMLGDPYALPNLRSMFGPDPGFDFFDMDLDRADLQVMVWEADDAMLKAALRMGADIHLLNAFSIENKEPPPLEELIERHKKEDSCTCIPAGCSRCYWDWRGPMKHKREFAKVFCHACVTGDHEVLTRTGWQAIEHVQDSTEIAVWAIEDQSIKFEIPKRWYRNFAAAGETLIAYEGQSFSQHVTANHKLPYTVDKDLRSCQAVDLPASARLPTTGLYSGEYDADEAYIRLLAAFQADGFFEYKYRVGWHFKKERKIQRLLMLLDKAGLQPTVQINETTRILAYWRPADWMKVPGSWLLGLNGQALDWWLDELQYWDAYKGATGAVHISSSNYEAAEWINTIAHLRGKGSLLNLQAAAEGNRKDNWRISLNNRSYYKAASGRIVHTTLKQATPVYCPETSTGYFMVRRNAKISVTGNTNYVGSARTIAGHLGRGVHEIDRAQKIWFGAHPGIKKVHTRVEDQVKRFRFVENRFGYRWYIFDRTDEILPEAVAWIPQSTVSIVINKIWHKLYTELPEVQVLLQVHDSLAGQYPSHRKAHCLAEMKRLSSILIPYDDPLIIPTGINTSPISWGDC